MNLAFLGRKRNEELELRNPKPTAKHRGESVMKWHSFSGGETGSFHLIERIMDQNTSLDILKVNFPRSVAFLFNTKTQNL